MGKLVVSENVSIDGVGQDPNGDEGFERGGWFLAMGDQDREAWASIELEEVMTADALLLGRRGYEWFAARWPSRAGAFADRLNSMPKYVVSSALSNPTWTNTTRLNGDVVDAVSRVKHAHNGNVVVYASFQLARTLLEHDLVDEVRLMIYPVVLGAGVPVFGPTSDKHAMRLIKCERVGESLVHLIYQVVNEG